MKKKIVYMLLALALTVTVVGCGKKKEDGATDNTNQTQDQTNTDADTDNTDTDTTEIDDTDTDNADDVQTVGAESPVDLLNGIWSQYAEEDKFAVAGGDFDEENATTEGAGRYGLEDAESLDYALGIPAACVEYLDDAASLIHMMNSNTFTCGAYHVADAANVDKVVEGLEQNIMERQWMCGMPDKLYIYTIDQYVVSFFGHEEPTSVFKTTLESVYPTAVLAYEGNITDSFEE